MESKASGWDTFVKVLEAILVILVVLVIVIGLIIGFQKLGAKEEDDDDPSETQTYY